MRNFKKLALSAVFFATLFGCKPVLAEEIDSDAGLPSDYESVSVETDESDTAALDSDKDALIVTNDAVITDAEKPQAETTEVVADTADSVLTENTVTDVAVSGENTDSSEATIVSDEDTDSSEVVTASATKHLTVLDGVDYSLVYDYEYYSANEDVKAAFGDDEAATLHNFVRWGMASQRQGNATFDEKSYRYAYQDLRLAYGTDYKSYYMHYIRYGNREGRSKTTGITEIQNPVTTENGVDYSLVYDYEYYSSNKDVKAAFGDDDIATLHNFVRWGMAGQRQGNATFDEKSYRYAYQDLRLAYGTDYKSYYMHYIRYGNREGRSKTTGITKILKPVTKENGVDYSLVYNYEYYSSNKDVKAAFGDDDVATLHNFVRWGMASQRQGNATFDEKSYRYAYQDLRQVYRLNYASYYTHYIKYGYKEGRSEISGVTTMQNPTTVFAGANYWNVYKNNTFSFDLSSIYDYFYYIENNPSLNNRDDDFAMIENFAVNGLVNWVRAKETMSESDYVYFRDTVVPYTKKQAKSYVTIGIAWGYESASLSWYTGALSNAGARYVILSQFTTVAQATAALASVDGVLLTGGNDVTPSMYGDSKVYAYNCNYARDLSDMCLVQAAYALDKPTLGICRGLQVMNVSFNDPAGGHYLGSLYQDLNAQGATSFSHMGNASVTTKRHDVYFTSGSMIANIYGTTTLSVTSAHHEGIRQLDTTHYVATGYATVGGTIIEAIEGIGKTFFIGVQFHPEALAANGEAQSLKIFQALVDKARWC